MPADDQAPGKDGLAVVVAGLDGSPSSINAAAWAGGLARRERATLLLVYIEPLVSPAYWTPIGLEGASDAAHGYVESMRRDSAYYLDQTGVPWDLLHERGDPAGELEAVAERHRADCIVVGRSRVPGGALGSVPKALLGLARRPVVVVP